MDFIVDFYKDLETLDLIIFWGIIIVLILLLIFSTIMMNKNKKLKKLVDKNNKNEYQDNKYEELPIKKDNSTTIDIEKKQHFPEETKTTDIKSEETNSIILPEIPHIPNEENNNQEDISKSIETEKKFIAEEHVMEYNKDLFSLSNIQKTSELKEKTNNDIKTKPTIEMPTGPYQRNVLREMSLSQTSPIGLTTPKKKEDKKNELAKDLEESLNTEQNESTLPKAEIKSLNKKEYEDTKKEIYKQNNDLYNKTHEQRKEEPVKYQQKGNYQETSSIIKKELSTIENPSPRKTEIIPEEQLKNRYNYEEKRQENTTIDRQNYEERKVEKETKREEITTSYKTENNEPKNQLYEKKQSEQRIFSKEEHKEIKKEIPQNNIDPRVKELLNSVSNPVEISQNKSSSEKYLEEVSRKLAEAEIPDEIERTDYELEQEENAIISYKELMEKKDSIQTIDEEEAVISIEELMNRNNQKQQDEVKIDTKLYKLTDEEENEDFIKELKQFRNDL